MRGTSSERLWRSGALWVAALTGVVSIAFAAFETPITDRITLFLSLPLALALFFLFALSVLISIVKLIRGLNRIGWRAGVPLFVNMCVAATIVSVPFNTLWSRGQFFYLLDERESVVKAVHDGVLRPNVDHNRSLIRLPDTYRELSDGGNEIVVEPLGDDFFVFFYEYRGILDNYSGYLYVPEGGRPEDCSQTWSSFMDIDWVAPHWYHLLST